MSEAGAGVCRVCGCSDKEPCLLVDGDLVDVDEQQTLPDGVYTCSWVEPDLCSGCVTPVPPPLLYDAHGRPLRGAP